MFRAETLGEVEVMEMEIDFGDLNLFASEEEESDVSMTGSVPSEMEIKEVSDAATQLPSFSSLISFFPPLPSHLPFSSSAPRSVPLPVTSALSFEAPPLRVTPIFSEPLPKQTLIFNSDYDRRMLKSAPSMQGLFGPEYPGTPPQRREQNYNSLHNPSLSN